MEQETGIRSLYDEFFRGYEAENSLTCHDFRPNSTYKQDSTLCGGQRSLESAFEGIEVHRVGPVRSAWPFRSKRTKNNLLRKGRIIRHERHRHGRHPCNRQNAPLATATSSPTYLWSPTAPLSSSSATGKSSPFMPPPASRAGPSLPTSMMPNLTNCGNGPATRQKKAFVDEL